MKRTWLGIITDMLEVALTPTNKMRIMYKSNLNFERFDKYFHNLLTKRFIEEINNSNMRPTYKTTKRGKTLLGILKRAHELVFSETP